MLSSLGGECKGRDGPVQAAAAPFSQEGSVGGVSAPSLLSCPGGG